MRHRRVLIGIVVYCSVVLGIAGNQHEGPDRPAGRNAWEWTLEERLSMRLDAPANPDEPSNVTDGGRTNTPGARFVIDGRRTPELFLPHELMAFLLAPDTDAAALARERAMYEPGLREMDITPSTFWRDFEAASRPYMTLHRSVNGEPTDETLARLCGARTDALQEMRRRYRRFDEFLYSEVAPGRVLAGAASPPTNWLTWLEGGCR